MSRLPIPGQDKGTWGGVLNDYLTQSHNADGTLANNVVGASQLQDSSVTITKLVDGTITASKLAGNIPSTKLDSATQTQLSGIGAVPDGSITTPKIASGGLAPSAVTGTAVVTADTRLSDQRTPTDASVTTAKIAAGGIAESAVTNLTTDLSGKLTASSNLSDLASPSTALSNLGAAPGLTTTAVKTTTYSAIANQLVPADATNAAFTVTLPTAPADKTRATVKKIDSSANAVTVAAGGSDVFNIAGGSTSASLSLQNQAVTVQYNSSTSIWYVVGDDLPLAQLNATYVAKDTLVLNVKDHGAKGDGATDDTVAIQAVIDTVGTAGGGTVYFPTGVYIISSALNLGGNTHHSVLLQGCGGSYNSDTEGTVIKQTSTSAHGIVSADTVGLAIEGITLDGPGSGTGDGIHLTWTVNQNILGLRFDRLNVSHFGANGISVQTGIVSHFSNVVANSNGGDGFYFYGGGTSLSFNACFATSNGGNGWNLNQMKYSNWSACAADANNVGYLFSGGCEACTLNGCGAEVNTTNGLVINGAFNITVNGFAVYNNNHYGVYVQGSSWGILLQDIWETAGSTPVYSIYTATGTSSTVIHYNTVTAANFAGTTNVIQPGVITTASLVGNASSATSTLGLDPIAGNLVTIPRWAAVNTGGLNTGSVQFVYFTADKTLTVGTVATTTGGTAAGATPTYCAVGLYSVDASNNLTRIAVTANTTSLWNSIWAQFSTALTSSPTLTFGNRYAVGILIVTGAVAPQLYGSQGAVLGNDGNVGTRICSTSATGQTTLLASYTADAANGGVGFMPYVRIH